MKISGYHTGEPLTRTSAAAIEEKNPVAYSDIWGVALQAMSNLHRSKKADDESAALVTQANLDAQTKHRLSQDDLRTVDEELDRRQTYLKSSRHLMQKGAVAVAQGELGLGALSGVVRTPLAQLSQSLQPNTLTLPARLAQDESTHLGDSRIPTPAQSSLWGDSTSRQPITSVDNDRPLTKNPDPLYGGSAQPSVKATPPPEMISLETLNRDSHQVVQRTVPRVEPNAPTTNQISKPINVSPSSSHTGMVLSVSETSNSGLESSILFKQPAPPVQVNSNHVGAKPEILFSPEAKEKTLNDVLQVIRAHTGKKESVIKMQLDPPELGKLLIDMRVSDDTLQIRIETGHQQVRELLSSHAGLLSQGLEEQGLRLDQLHIVFNDPQSPQPDAMESRSSSDWGGGSDHFAWRHTGRELWEGDLPDPVEESIDLAGMNHEQRMGRLDIQG